MMKDLVYQGPGQRGWDTVDDATIIDQTDIVVRIRRTYPHRDPTELRLSTGTVKGPTCA